MPEEKKLTAEEAEAMLAQLTAHFHEPVMPITRYCDGLRKWASCMNRRVQDMRKKLFPGTLEPHGTDAYTTDWAGYNAALKGPHPRELVPTPGRREYTPRDYELDLLLGYVADDEHVSRVNLLISKSSLLDRLLYGRETFRTEKCPIHKGKWSGIEFTPSEDGRIKGNVCPHQCHLTGWIQHPDDTAKWRASVDHKFPETCETCSHPYEKDALSVCSNFFHCCRDCFWLHGQVLFPCKTHIDEWTSAHAKKSITLP